MGDAIRVSNPYYPSTFELYRTRKAVRERWTLARLIGEPWEGGPDDITMSSIVVRCIDTGVGTAYAVVYRQGVHWLVTHPHTPGCRRDDAGRLCLSDYWE